MGKRLVTMLSLVAALLLLATSAIAMSVSGTSRTVLEWYEDVDGDKTMPVYEYLQVSGRSIADTGWSFYGYGRLADDLKDNASVDNRLYSAYLYNEDVVDGLSVKLGRQFVSTSAGASIMDGLYANYSIADVNVTVFGGGDAAFYKGYDEQDLIGGAEARWEVCENFSLGGSYLIRSKNSYLEDELIGGEFEAAYGDYDAYGEAQYDVLTDKISYGFLGHSGRPVEDFSYSIEYLYSLPVFGASSIYSVFAVDEYQEVTGEVAYRVTPGIRTFASVSKEIYDASDAFVYEAGVEKLKDSPFSGYLVGTIRSDEAEEDLYGAKAYGAYSLAQDITLGAGAHIDVMERAIDDVKDETTSQRLWVDGLYSYSKDIDLRGKVERVESDLWDYYYRGQVSLTVKF